MKITAINQQQKRHDRYSIFIDEKYTFSLGESELLRLGLRIGVEFSESQIEELKDTAALDKAYDRVLGLLARRPRSEWEVWSYLKRKDYDENVSNAVVEKLRDRSYVNDLAFAEAWVSSRRLLKPMSKRKLSYELKQKRITDDIVARVLEDDETTDMIELVKLIEKKRRQTRYQDEQKLMGYLVRQGYGYSDVKAALQQLASS